MVETRGNCLILHEFHSPRSVLRPSSLAWGPPFLYVLNGSLIKYERELEPMPRRANKEQAGLATATSNRHKIGGQKHPANA
ncbi:hypothetical protein [Paenibacillus gorillae]|uniref:hypothetical protein n=1 Tax=Paenibacillus gorillae TaxID=1243662 RepID=UPI0005A9BA90|nr:hypothetical protein [Paenibacillus gorillae]